VGHEADTQMGRGRQRGTGVKMPQAAGKRGTKFRPAVGDVPPTLTLHHSPRVLPRSDQLVPHLHLLSAAHHGKGQVCLERDPSMHEHLIGRGKGTDSPHCPWVQEGVLGPEQRPWSHMLTFQLSWRNGLYISNGVKS
jgi:hypothetical protein